MIWDVVLHSCLLSEFCLDKWSQTPLYRTPKGAPTHPVFIGVKNSTATQRGTELRKSIQQIFLAGQSLPHVLFPYSMLWRLYKIKQGLYDLFCWWQNLGEKKKTTPFKWGSHRACERGDERKFLKQRKAHGYLGMTTQSHFLTLPYRWWATAQKSYLGNPIQIQPRFSFKQRKSSALRRRKTPNSILFSRLDDKGSNMRKVHSMKTELKRAEVR